VSGSAATVFWGGDTFFKRDAPGNYNWVELHGWLGGGSR
jgi:hypothetical protein